MYRNPPNKPSRVQTALDYLDYCESVTHQCDVSAPARALTQTEQKVREAALRVLQSYFLGEMDFGDLPPMEVRPESDEEGGATVREPVDA
jgi:hypothetical protein